MNKAKTHNLQEWRHQLARASMWIFYGLLAYMPLHILLSTWIGTSFDILTFTKIAKEIVLVIGFACIAVAVPTRVYKNVLKSRFIIAILLYVFLTIVLAIVMPTDIDAEVLGLVYNTRFLLFALYGLLLTNYFRPQHILKRSVQVVLVVSVPVLLFGILQYTLLSPNALESIGYGRQNGVLPFFAIDNKPDLERVMSTLRDPNSYGSYLIIIGSLAASLLLFTKNKGTKKIVIGLLGLIAINLLLTFSRSAWIGFTIAVITIILLGPHIRPLFNYVKRFIFPLSVLGLILVVGLFITRDSYLVQNIIFHADESTTLEDPNQLRTRFYKESIESIADNPTGHGPGTAGLASIKHDKTVLNESYYLQVAYEVGVLGLAIFIAIIIFAAQKVYYYKKYAFGLGLLAAFIGLGFTNSLVHIWSNEAVAYTWWGLAGLLIATQLFTSKKTSKPS